MKKVLFAACACLVLLSACKKEQVSIEEAELTLECTYTGVTQPDVHYNYFDYDAMLPDDLGLSKVSINVSSNADPVGISFEDNLSKGSYKKGKYEYNYLRATGQIRIGAFTDEERKMIKVGYPDDVITVSIGDSIVSETITANTNDALSISYGQYQGSETLFGGNIFLYGHSFDGTENPSIKVSSSYDSNPITIQGQWNDPNQYNGLPAFNSYSFEVDFVKDDATSGNMVGVNDGCEVYLEYEGIVYVSTFMDNKSSTLPQL